jgi:hypothetical protein
MSINLMHQIDPLQDHVVDLQTLLEAIFRSAS